MYKMLVQEAKEAGLRLRWPRHLPNTRRALATAEWARHNQPHAFPELHKRLFEAHFVKGEDLEDLVVIDRHAGESGINLAALHGAFTDGSAEERVTQAEIIGRKHDVQGTPAWLLGHQLIAGLRPAAEFERLAAYALQLNR
jgi:predicted DsbA family dithiol-disulfide isomerase